MKISNILSQRKFMILALGLILTIFSLVWLFGGSRINAQSDDARQPTIAQAATGTGFTYQGQINQSSIPADGNLTFRFVLYDSAAGGNQIGNAQTESIAVSGGLFTVVLNDTGQFGASAFNGEARYLEVRVSDNGGAGFTTLTPRQALNPAPYAHSLRPGAVIDSTVDNAAILNLSNNGTNGTGLSVNSEGIGMYVQSAGSTGMLVDSSGASGFYVSNAATNGLRVFSAETGVNVNRVTQDGLFVCATGANTTCTPNDSIHSGVEVGNAEHYGLWVTNTGNDGVFIVNAGDDGMQVVAAGDDGIDVQGATDDGVRVRTVGGDGLEVESAGDNGVLVSSAVNNGVKVDSAFIGVYVQNTTATGVLVASPGASGLFVSNAGGYGVRVASSTDFAGSFNGNIEVTGACTGCLLATFGINSGDTPLQPGDVVALQGIRSGESSGQSMLMDVSQAQAGAPVVGVVYGRGELVETESPDGQMVTHLAPREGVVQAGDYVHIVIYGPVQVRASALGGAIQLGDKLAVDNSGAARTLQTRELDGMQISESGPALGIALESLDGDQDGFIWVLVNPQ